MLRYAEGPIFEGRSVTKNKPLCITKKVFIATKIKRHIRILHTKKHKFMKFHQHLWNGKVAMTKIRRNNASDLVRDNV